jgi:hygromycin-B 7''-O-kinase
MTLREYSTRLGNISDEQLQMALDRLDMGDLIRAEPISFGLFGQNLFITSTKGEFVLRGVPHYDWQFPTEKFFVEQLHRMTKAPVPYPYLYETATDIFGWSFVLMPRMRGLQIADHKIVSGLTWQDRQGIARALAKMLAEIQTLSWDYAGKYDSTTGKVQPTEQDYREWIVKRIRELLLIAHHTNGNTPTSDLVWAESIIASGSHVLHTPYQPCIVLEDYKEANTVVEHTENGWTVSGIFDLMTAHFGDGEADLARQVGTYLRENPTLADEFVQTDIQCKPIQVGFIERQQLYMLYDSVLIWAFWQEHAGGLPENKTLTFEQWANPFIAYWRKFKNIRTYNAAIIGSSFPSFKLIPLK